MVHPGDLVGKRVLNVKTRKDGKGRMYISRFDFEDDLSIILMPTQSEMGRIVTFFEMVSKDQQPRTWKQRLLDKLVLKLKLKIESYENRNKPAEPEEFQDETEDEKLGKAKTEIQEGIPDIVV